MSSTQESIARLQHHIGQHIVGQTTLVNRLLYPDTSDSGSFITLFYLEIDLALRRLRWVRAGHDPAMVYDPQTDRFSEMGGRGMALGIQPESEFVAEETPLGSSGQIIVIGTDGIWEAHNPQGEMFGKARVHEVIRRHCQATAATIRDQLFEAVAAFSAGRQEDDLTLAVIKVL